MKKNVISHYEKRLSELKVRKNYLEGDELTATEDAINAMTELIDALKADETDHTAEEAMKAMQDAIEEKIKALAEKIAEPAPAEENFLKSKNSVKAYAGAMRNAFANKTTLSTEWNKVLRENGITITEGDEFAYTPDYVRGYIQDKWQKDFNWLNALKNTGAKAYAVRYQATAQDSTSPDVRAHGYTEGNTKTAQALTMIAKEVNAQYVYKLINISNKTIWDDDTALVNYVIDELYSQWLYEVQRCILIGDGRLSNSADKVKSIESIARASSDDFVTVATINASNPFIDELVTMLESINTGDGNEIFLFMNRTDINALRKVVIGSGATPQYQPVAVMAEMLGVSRIIETPLMTTTATKPRVIAMRPDKYILVGSLEPKLDSWEDYLKNEQYYRVEVPVGGAVEGLKSASVLLNPSL